MIVLRRRQPPERDLRLPLGRLRERRARPARGSSACTWSARWPTASSRASSQGAKRAARGRPDGAGRPRSGRWSRATSSRLVRELVDDAVAAGATLRCGGPARGARTPRRGLLRARRAHGRHPRHADHARGDLRPGGADRDRGLARGGDRPGQRLRVRPRRVGVDASTARKSERIARRIEAGMVWVNDHMYSHGACHCAWGGVKDSGLGRSHSKFGLYECVNVKLVTLGAVAHARLLVAPLRRDRSAAASTPPRSSSTGATRTSPPPCGAGIGPLLRLVRKSLRDAFRR